MNSRIIRLECCLCVFCFLCSSFLIMILTACGTKTFKFENITEVELISGSNGDIVEITEQEQIQPLILSFAGNEFIKGESSANQSGWSYRLKFYQGDKVKTDIVVMSSGRINFEGYFYDAKDGTINTAYYDELLSHDLSPAQSPNVLVPSIMLDNILFYLVGKGSLDIEIDESEYLGRVTSIVPITEWPTENGQSNIPVEGAPYAKHNDGIILLWNDEWQLFEARN